MYIWGCKNFLDPLSPISTIDKLSNGFIIFWKLLLYLKLCLIRKLGQIKIWLSLPKFSCYNIFNDLSLKWMVQCHKDVYQNLRLRLEYAYLLLNKFIMNRINSELIKIGRKLMSFLVTESSCDDTLSANKKNPQSKF